MCCLADGLIQLLRNGHIVYDERFIMTNDYIKIYWKLSQLVTNPLDKARVESTIAFQKSQPQSFSNCSVINFLSRFAIYPLGNS